jgi:hypothetical protein
MCVAIEDLYLLSDQNEPNFGPTPSRILAFSPHFPALLRRLVELVGRFHQPQMFIPLARRTVPGLALCTLRRLVATQPRARWLLLSPGFQLQWNLETSVWEEAQGEKTLRGIMEFIDTVHAPIITPTVKRDARKVCSHFRVLHATRESAPALAYHAVIGPFNPL